jgi:hypothetical protein
MGDQLSSILHTLFWLLIGAVPWWGWLLRSIGTVLATMITFWISDNTESGAWALRWWLVSIMSAVASVVYFFIGLVRFIHWAFS